MKRRGQAAMEFLMTYGWAILAAIIVIGVLAIYFRPGSLTPQSAVLSAPFYAVASDVSNTTWVQLEIQNNGGETLNGVNVTLSVTQPTGGDCPTTFAIGTMPAGQTNVTTFSCTGLTSGDTFSADVSVLYRRTGSSIDLTSSGTMSDTVP